MLTEKRKQIQIGKLCNKTQTHMLDNAKHLQWNFCCDSQQPKAVSYFKNSIVDFWKDKVLNTPMGTHYRETTDWVINFQKIAIGNAASTWQKWTI